MTDKAKLEKIKKLANAMYYAAFNLTTDASLLRKAMDEYHKFIIHECKEEPVSEDTMTISKEWFEHCKKSWYNEGYIDGEYNRDRQFEDSVSEDLGKAAVEIVRKELIDKAVGWIKEINNHHHIMRYSDSCEPPLSELIEWFKNYMKEGGKDE